MTLCFATNNRNKINEVQGMLGGAFQLITLSDIGCHKELAEDQDTLEGNSFQKADYVFRQYGVAAFADDSGLAVDGLNGAPGVLSARYAGPARSDSDNIDLLLKNLDGRMSRQAHFRTIITLVDRLGINRFEGVIPGRILTTRCGTGGFGYDPIFVPDGHSLSFAEMSEKEKNEISHRARAFRKLVDFLQAKRPVPSGHE